MGTVPGTIPTSLANENDSHYRCQLSEFLCFTLIQNRLQFWHETVFKSLSPPCPRWNGPARGQASRNVPSLFKMSRGQ